MLWLSPHTDKIKISDTLDSDNTQPLENKSSMDTMESFLLPGPTYIAPSSEFFISPGLNHRSSLDFLPTRDAADELVRQYFNAVHVIVRLVHKHAFDEVYGRFWTQLSAGLEPAASNQAVLFAAMFCGAVSMAEEMVFHYFGVEKRIIVDSLRSGCEHALAKANVLRSMKLETLQAFVMYLVRTTTQAETRRAPLTPDIGPALSRSSYSSSCGSDQHCHQDRAVPWPSQRRGQLWRVRNRDSCSASDMVSAMLSGHQDLRGYGSVPDDSSR